MIKTEVSLIRYSGRHFQILPRIPGADGEPIDDRRGYLDITDAHSNTFELEWPKGSGRLLGIS